MCQAKSYCAHFLSRVKLRVGSRSRQCPMDRATCHLNREVGGGGGVNILPTAKCGVPINGYLQLADVAACAI